MQTLENAITEKTKELCQTILDQPAMREARQRIQSFIADEKARAQYDGLVAQGEALQQKQQRAETLSSEEVSAFEKDREALLNNPVARGFLDAQEQFHNVHHSINRYISKTLELGRVPAEADLEDGECGHGCGCGGHHH